MARILYWNINNFTDGKIAPTKKRSRKDSEFGTGASGPQHLEVILDTLQPTDPNTAAAADLDFIVVVEIYGRMGPADEGELIEGSGLDGCIRLRDEIHNNLNGLWSMVPPVVTGTDGRREAIAIFYRHDNWYFLGPQTWPANYPFDLRTRLPNRVIPANYPYRGGQNERRSAGQWEFPQTLGPGAMGPAALVNFPGADHRKPWLAAFGDINNHNNLIRIMGIHTTPNDMYGGPAYADQGTTNLADVDDMTARAPDAANQIDVIVGDFNVDNLTAANFAAGGPFARLIGVGPNAIATPYTPLVRPPAGLNAQYQSYYHTHGKPAYDAPGDAVARIIDDTLAPPWWQRAGHYPGQEYSGLSIDNALVRYQGLAAPPPGGHHMTILARARQQPYNAPAPLPPVAPMLGHYESVVFMDETIGDIYNDLTANPMAAILYDANARFREWENYAKIYSVSDHFALLFDV